MKKIVFLIFVCLVCLAASVDKDEARQGIVEIESQQSYQMIREYSGGEMIEVQWQAETAPGKWLRIKQDKTKDKWEKEHTKKPKKIKPASIVAFAVSTDPEVVLEDITNQEDWEQIITYEKIGGGTANYVTSVSWQSEDLGDRVMKTKIYSGHISQGSTFSIEEDLL